MVAELDTETRKRGTRKSRLLISLVVVVVMLTISSVTFIVLYAIEASNEKAQDQLCTTSDCLITAANIVKNMNLTADPCKDFNEYACGNFIKNTVLSDSGTEVDTFGTVTFTNLLVMKDIITEVVNSGDPQYLTNMKYLYMSCMDEDAIEDVGLKLFFSETTFINDWPTLNMNWTEANYNLSAAVARYEQKQVGALFSFYVGLDEKDSSKTALHLQDSVQGLAMEYFQKPRDDAIIMAYERYLTETAIVLGADSLIAAQDAKEVLNLEIELTKIMVPKEDRRNISNLYNPVILKDLYDVAPDLDIPGALKAAFSAGNVNLPDTTIVINLYPKYIANISGVLNRFPKRTIQNLFAFRYALSRVAGLTKALRDITLRFNKVYMGITAEASRWEHCLTTAATAFQYGMAKEYVDRTYLQSTDAYFETMIANLKKAFRQLIQETTWMSASTKQAAYTKLEAITQTIGYEKYSTAIIEATYRAYKMSENQYDANMNFIIDYQNYQRVRSIPSLVGAEFEVSSMAPFEVNAQYSSAYNDITLPAGILQAPFYSPKYPDSMNYGAIGAIVGHELTHGFDDKGSQYDAQGNLRNWWPADDRANFLNRTQCIVDQNNNFYVPEIQMHVNGINTQGETAADNGGLKQSFRAYKQLASAETDPLELPGVKFTQDQLFFLSYAQIRCEVINKQRLLNLVDLDAHPPDKYRIIGPLQNSEDFAKAFNCPLGSYMNPVKKCSVW